MTQALEPGDRRGLRSLYLCDSTGRIVCRRPERWSLRAEACLGCGTTERPHEARGLCHRCYAAWKYRTNWRGTADKRKARSKAIRLTDEGEKREREWLEFRRTDPRHRELRRQVANAWAKRNGKFAVGKRVRYELIPGHWIDGTIIENGRGRATVRFKATEDTIPHRKLQVIE